MNENQSERSIDFDANQNSDPNFQTTMNTSAANTVDKYLTDHHTPSQKINAYILGPVMTALCLVFALATGTWQSYVVFVCMLATAAAWLPAVTLSKNQQYAKSTVITLASSLLFVTVAMALTIGLESAGAVACIILPIQASMYSRRFLYWGMGAGITSFCASTLFRYFAPGSVVPFSNGVQLGLGLVLMIVLGLLTVHYLRRIYAISQSLVKSIAKRNASQHDIIDTANEIYPVIDQALKKIASISKSFADKAGTQSETAGEVNVTTQEVYHIAVEMVDSAEETKTISDKTRQELIANSTRLKTIENSLNQVVQTIDTSRSEVVSLTRQVERIEQILDSNREIGQQIKILAINAAIEAAKAGEFGHGFRVVAAKLRELIHTTDENLTSSHTLLEEIRNQSNESAATIKLGSEQLLKHFEDLHLAAKTIETSAEKFEIASHHVEQIGYAAQEQQVGMQAVASTMDTLDSAASELNKSASSLLEAVSQITQTQNSLREALSIG
jgi:methyl-accepting chemotaxis protein